MTPTERSRIEALMDEAAQKGYNRRQLVARAAALGISIPAASMLLGGAPAMAQDGGSRVVLAMSVEPDTLENWRAYSTDGHPVLRNVQEALLNRDPETNELVGELATAWEQTDDVTWRFTLREGVTFHNGEAFNAEVAAFGINYTYAAIATPIVVMTLFHFVDRDKDRSADSAGARTSDGHSDSHVGML